MPAKSARSPNRDAIFFSALKADHTVACACIAAGYARRSVYRWRRDDPAFAAAWHDADVHALEAEADRRLARRYKRPVYAGGEIVGTRVTCPDELLFMRYEALLQQRPGRAAASAFVAAPPSARAAPSTRPRRWLGWFAKLPLGFPRSARANAR